MKLLCHRWMQAPRCHVWLQHAVFQLPKVSILSVGTAVNAVPEPGCFVLYYCLLEPSTRPPHEADTE